MSSRTVVKQTSERERIGADRKARTRVRGEATRSAKPSGLLCARNLKKGYRKGKLVVPVLKGVDFTVQSGEFTAIVGQSGSGKSTLLHLLGTLDQPDSGEIYYHSKRIDNLRPIERDRLRNRSFGMIFQFYHLLPELSTLENVLVPKMISESTFSYWRNKRKYIERAERMLELVGLSHRLTHKPSELSGGEMQRTAIARALISDPKLLLADEPTGNLDRENGQEVMRILRELNLKEKVTIVMVTHDQSIAEQSDTVVRLLEGQVERP